LWIGCSDSRIPESVLSGVERGRIFVHRNIGNQVDSQDATHSALASVEYAVRALGVRSILIVGHTDCGAVQFSIASAQGGNAAHSRFPVVARYLHSLILIARRVLPSIPPGVAQTERELLVAKQNVRDQARAVFRSGLYIASDGRRVPIKGYVYHIGKQNPWEGVIMLGGGGARATTLSGTEEKGKEEEIDEEGWFLRETDEFEENIEI
ncbi:carbonic anhydrase, partial [Panus rudis PR-1116 ss-1]